MPVATAAKTNINLRRRALAFSIHYLLDPKRGADKNLPSTEELRAATNSDIEREDIEYDLYNEAGSNNLTEIVKNKQKLQEILAIIEKEVAKPKESAVPKFTSEDLAAAKAAKGRPSALGILAELETIEPLLRKHNLETSAKLKETLTPQVKSVITSLGIKDLPADQLENLSQEIAREVARETLENVPKIADVAQAQDVITDSLVQTLQVDPILSSKVAKISEQKLVEKSTQIADQIAETHQKDLEKTAVLGSITEIASLGKPTQDDLQTISEIVEQTVEAQAPLTIPTDRQSLKGSLLVYLTSYQEELAKQLPSISPTNLPSFNELQKAKVVAHTKATAKVAEEFSETVAGKQIANKIGYNQLSGNLAVTRGMAPPQVANQIPLNLPVGAGLILGSATRQDQAYLALLAHDQEKLNREIKKTTAETEKFKKQKSLSRQNQKDYQQAKLRLARYQKAQELATKKPKRTQGFQSLFTGNQITRASQIAWNFDQNRLGFYLPQTLINSSRFGPRLAFGAIAPGSLSFFGRISPGFNFSASHLSPAFGMGMDPTGVLAATPMGLVKGIGGWVRNIAGLAFGGLALYFAALGGAALKGFLIGVAAGGSAGTIAGAVIPIALFGPAGILLWPVTIPLGFFLGGSIGGTAGGLIGLGLASGSATAISTGVGVGIGGTVGAVTGGVIGFTVVGAIPVIGPFLAPLGAILGATIGAYVGAFIGGALGYLFGHYVLTTLGAIGTGAAVGFLLGGPVGAAIGAGIGWLVSGGWAQVKSFFAGTSSAVGGAGAGFFSAAGSFFTGLASTIWGGLSAAGGAITGFLSGAGNLLIGISGLSPSVALAAVPVAGSIGAIAIGGTIVGIVTATTFFNPETDVGGVQTPGENQFLSISKTASPERMDLPGPDITFTITLTAKTNLEEIRVIDQLRVTNRNGTFSITADKNGNQFSPVPCNLTLAAGEQCTYIFTITTDNRFEDSIVTNTAEVTAKPVGQQFTSANATTTVIIGNPPAACPRGWPATGRVSQGPEGSFSHSSAQWGQYEAIDIAQAMGRPVYATVEGTVIESRPVNDFDQRLGIQPIDCPGLNIVNYWHLSAVFVVPGEVVRYGQEIGRVGAFVIDGVPQPHTHYQFNRPGDRSFKIEPPYIPVAVPRTCNSEVECNVTITNAP